MAIHKLRENWCERVTKKGLYNDGGGLCLQVGEGGRAKSWIFRFAVNGRERHKGLGSFDTYTLDEAREKARLCRQMRAEGIDPIEHAKAQRHEQTLAARLAAKKDLTFRECAEKFLDAQAKGLDDWRPGTLRHARSKIPKYLYPTLANVRIQDIDVEFCEQALKPLLDRKKKPTAKQTHMFLSSILRWAKGMEYRTGDNPADLKGPLGRRLPALRRVHHKPRPCLDYKKAGQFVAALREFKYEHWINRVPVPARALEFLVLTGVRTEQVVGLPWKEIDWEERLWVCPPERHKSGGKTNSDYIVPLSDQAMRILEEMRTMQQENGFYREDGFVFLHGPSTDRLRREVHARAGGRQISKPSIGMFLQQQFGDWRDRDGRRIVPHGFRTTFGDWSVEMGYEERDSEIALGHTVGNQVRNRYKRNAHRIEPRRLMMQAWANYCDQAEPSSNAKIIQMRSAK